MSDNLFLKNYLQELGLESRQSDIFLTTYQYGPKPASTIASLCHTERSYCYKVLEEFVAQGLVEQTMIRNTKHYYIVSSDVILQKLQQEQDKVTTLRE
jgi:sugar-specific transcriptional regulator TrmB